MRIVYLCSIYLCSTFQNWKTPPCKVFRLGLQIGRCQHQYSCLTPAGTAPEVGL